MKPAEVRFSQRHHVPPARSWLSHQGGSHRRDCSRELGHGLTSRCATGTPKPAQWVQDVGDVVGM
jgi:hypothetical protein